MRDEARLAAHLDAELGSAQRRRANAFAGRQQPRRKRSLVELRANGATEPAPHVAEVSCFALIDIFGDAARKDDTLDGQQIERIGQPEFRRGRIADRGDERIRHDLRQPVEIGATDPVADVPVEARGGEIWLRGGVAAGDDVVARPCQLPPPDRERAGRHDAAVDDARELRGAAPDIDIRKRRALLHRALHRARPIGREHRLHVMACGRTDEFAEIFGKHLRDRLRIVARHGFARQDHDARLDVVGRDAGGGEGAVDDGAQPCLVDAMRIRERRQRDGRKIECRARGGVPAHRQRFAGAAHQKAREGDLRSRRADVDPHADERHAFERA